MDKEDFETLTTATHVNGHSKQHLNKYPHPMDDEFACEYAARFGHLHVLQWLRSQNPPCPWNQQSCLYYIKTL